MAKTFSSFFGSLGIIFIALILFLGTFALIKSVFSATSSTVSGEVVVGNVAPVVSNVILNNGSAITLNANATTAVPINFTISDNNGCADVFQNGNVTSTGYRISVGKSCSADNLSCYIVGTTTNDCAGGSTSANATATLEIYYFAEATDASSSYPSDYWEAFIVAKDGSGATSSASSTGVELNTLVAIDFATSSINYGTLSASSTSGAVNQEFPILNVGNSTATISVDGTAFISGANSFATSSQHYATTTFIFGGTEPSLTGAQTTISGLTLLPRISLVNDLGSWTETTALPSSSVSAGYTNSLKYIYVTGGESTTTVRVSKFNPDGSIGPWSNTEPLDKVRIGHATLFNAGYIYIIAGKGFTPDAIYAPVSATGSISSWTATQAPGAVALYNFSSLIYKGHAYVFGGSGISDGSETNSVQYTTINSDGSLGTWAALNSLPYVISKSAAVAYDDNIYVLGGGYKTSVATTTVVFAPVNSDGTLGSWTETTPLPGARSGHGAIAEDGYIYVIGGSTSTVIYAPINSDGTIGSWSELTSLPNSRDNTAVIVNNGYLYALPNSGSTTTVLFSKINNALSKQSTFWGVTVPTIQSGIYLATTTFTGSYSP